MDFQSASFHFLCAVYDPRFIGTLDTFLAAHHVDLRLERLLAKILTILVPMNEHGAWPASAGGGVPIGRPRDARNAFNPLGRYAEFGAMETVHATALEPNRGVVFSKTHNSWRAVEPVVVPASSPLVRRMLSVVVYWS